MKQLKRQYPIVCLAVLLTVLLSSCGREDPGPEAAAQPDVELRMVTGDANNSDLADALEALLAETHPNMTLKSENWSRWPRDYLTSNEPPDLMAIGAGDWVLSTIREGLVADITDVWEQSNLNATFPTNLQALTEYSGKQYMLPIGYDWRGIYYNLAVFDQYGLTPPETWDQLMQIADTLLLNGEIPFSLAGRNEWVAGLWFDYLNLRLNGPTYHQALIAGEIPYTDDGLRDVLFTWQFLFEKGYFVSNPQSVSDLQSLTALVRGDRDSPLNREKAVMALAGPGEVDELPAVFKEELGFFAFPTINPEIPRGEVIASFGYLVPASAPNRLDALKYLAFAASPEVQALLTQYAGQGSTFIPAHIGSDVDNLAEDVQDGWSIVQAAEGTHLPLMWASPAPMRNALESAISAFFRNMGRDTMDIDAILAKLEEKRLELLGQGVFEN